MQKTFWILRHSLIVKLSPTTSSASPHTDTASPLGLLGTRLQDTSRGNNANSISENLPLEGFICSPRAVLAQDRNPNTLRLFPCRYVSGARTADDDGRCASSRNHAYTWCVSAQIWCTLCAAYAAVRASERNGTFASPAFEDDGVV